MPVDPSEGGRIQESGPVGHRFAWNGETDVEQAASEKCAVAKTLSRSCHVATVNFVMLKSLAFWVENPASGGLCLTGRRGSGGPAQRERVSRLLCRSGDKEGRG